MSRLVAFSVRNVIPENGFLFPLMLVVLLLGGCSLELPSDNEEGGEISLASRIEGFAAAPRAVWDAKDREITVRGAGLSNGVAISNAATGQFIGAAHVDDDDDDGGQAQLVLNNVTAVPCSITVQIGGREINVPVRNAPANCVGTTNTPLNSTLNITKAKWKASSSKLTIKGDGAVPRQLVSVFDSISGKLLGTDQSNSVGKWKVKVRDLLVSPCFVSVVADTHTIESIVTNAPASCNSFSGIIPNNPTFNQAPDSAIIGPIGDMSVRIGSSIRFTGTGFDPDSDGALTYQWDFDFVNQSDVSGYSTEISPTVIFSEAGVFRVSLIVTDNLNLSDPTPDTRVIVVQPSISTNQLPSGAIVSPQANVEINVGGFVNFGSVGTDLDGSISSYIWNFAGGAVNSSLQNPGNVMFSSPGVYLVSLTVVDNDGLADPTPQVVSITVRGGNTGTPGANNPANRAPNGEITNPSTDITVSVGETIDFTATAIDVDNNSPLSYIWNFGSISPVSSQLNPGAVRFDKVGVYTVRFIATDSLGVSDLSPSIRIITVMGDTSNNNLAPESTITLPSANMTITAGQSVNFMGSGSDADNNQPLKYRWNFSGAAISSAMQNPGAIKFDRAGTFNVSLTVSDGLGMSDATPAIRIITVVPNNAPGSGNGNTTVNLPPESFINMPSSNIVINVGDEVDFMSTGSDPENNSPLIYQWAFDGVAPDSIAQNPGKMVFSRAGSYRVRLMVKDAMGNIDPTPAERLITVNDASVSNLEPQGTITSPVSSLSIDLGQTVNFSAIANDPDGTVKSYIWDFGGAAIMSLQQNPGDITFNEPGIFKVSLHVKDNAGFYDSTSDVRFITVVNANNMNQAPNAKIVSPATDIMINIDDSVMFSGAGEDADNFGSVLSYSWNFGGVVPNSSQAAPGVVKFEKAGSYSVSLSVMDNFGLSDLTPAVRKITVIDNSASNSTPNVRITSAGLSSNINAGDSLKFAATATDSTPGTLSYFWNFDGAETDSIKQNPGDVKFNKAGVYNVSVYVRDALNKRSNVASYKVTVGSTTQSAMPNASIVTPTSNVSIMLGETINFIGSAVDSDSPNSDLSYRWYFDGIAASSNAQNPGNVTFDKVGVFKVALTVADNTGATDLSPAIRTVTVIAHNATTFPGTGGSGASNQAPNGSISSPTAALSNIAVGDSIDFSATAVDADNNLPIAYRWSFGNGMPDAFVQNPGIIEFTNPGTYTVSLTVTDSLGLVDRVPDVRTIIVGNGGGASAGGVNSPNGIIDMPTALVTISKGQTVFFSGSAIDPNLDGNITYSWDFAGGAAISTQKVPGDVMFSNLGQFMVSLTVTDSTGLVDQTPMVRIVTVLP